MVSDLEMATKSETNATEQVDQNVDEIQMDMNPVIVGTTSSIIVETNYKAAILVV